MNRPIDLDPIETLLDGRASRGTTHWGACHEVHVDCAARRLVAEVRKLRGNIGELEDELQVEANAHRRSRERVATL